MIVLAVPVVMVALAAALLAADRIAVAHVQGRIAAHVGNWGFPAGPRVRIAGFPFLPQLAAGRLGKVVICAAGKKLGPVQVKRLDVTLYGVRADRGGKGRIVSRLSGTALVGFAGLPEAGFLRDIAFSLSVLPLAMMIQSVSVTSEGVRLHLAGRDVRIG